MFSSAINSLYENQEYFDIASVEPIEESRYSADVQGVLQVVREMYEEDALIEAQTHAIITNEYIRLTESASDRQELLEELSVLTEGKMKDYIEKIKEFFKKVWAKITGILDKFISYLAAAFMDGKKFAKKYRKTLVGKDLASFSGKMYKYNLANLNKETMKELYTKLSGDVQKSADLYIGKIDKEKYEASKKFVDEKLQKQLWQTATGKSASDVEDFNENVKLMFKSEEKEEFEKDSQIPHSITTMLDTLENGKLVKNAESTKRAAAKHYSDIIKFYDNMLKEVKEDDSTGVASAKHTGSFGDTSSSYSSSISSTGKDNNEYLMKYIALKKTAHTKAETVGNAVLSKYVEASKSCVNEFKSVLGAAVRHNEKN